MLLWPLVSLLRIIAAPVTTATLLFPTSTVVWAASSATPTTPTTCIRARHRRRVHGHLLLVLLVLEVVIGGRRRRGVMHSPRVRDAVRVPVPARRPGLRRRGLRVQVWVRGPGTCKGPPPDIGVVVGRVRQAHVLRRVALLLGCVIHGAGRGWWLLALRVPWHCPGVSALVMWLRVVVTAGDASPAAHVGWGLLPTVAHVRVFGRAVAARLAMVYGLLVTRSAHVATAGVGRAWGALRLGALRSVQALVVVPGRVLVVWGLGGLRA